MLKKNFLVAEISSNHCGSFQTAKKLIACAKKNGAEAIKNQNHILSDEMINEAKKVIPSNTNKSIYKVIEENLMTFEDEKKLKKHLQSPELKTELRESIESNLKSLERRKRLEYSL